jgi:Rhabdovirus nucleocapsid protein
MRCHAFMRYLSPTHIAVGIAIRHTYKSLLIPNLLFEVLAAVNFSPGKFSIYGGPFKEHLLIHVVGCLNSNERSKNVRHLRTGNLNAVISNVFILAKMVRGGNGMTEVVGVQTKERQRLEDSGDDEGPDKTFKHNQMGVIDGNPPEPKSHDGQEWLEWIRIWNGFAYGCADSFSAYTFESYMKEMKPNESFRPSPTCECHH